MQMKRYLRVTLQVIEKLLQLIGLLVVLRAAFPPLKATIPPARAGARSPGDARVAEGLVGWGCDTTQRGAILCVDPFASPGGPGSYTPVERLVHKGMTALFPLAPSGGKGRGEGAAARAKVSILGTSSRVATWLTLARYCPPAPPLHPPSP